MTKTFNKGKVLLVALATLLLVVLMTSAAFASEYVAEVTIEDTTTGYTDFGTAWQAALDGSDGDGSTVKLLTDWIAPDGVFYYTVTSSAGTVTERGSQDGAISMQAYHTGFLYPHITIDLNGYKIDRNLSSKTSDGHVIYIEHGKLTIMDSSPLGTGKITG